MPFEDEWIATRTKILLRGNPNLLKKTTSIIVFRYFENKLEKKSYKRYNKKKNGAGYQW